MEPNEEELNIDSLFEDDVEEVEVLEEPEQSETAEPEQQATEPEGETQEGEPESEEASEGEQPEAEEKQPVMVPIAEVHKSRNKAKQYEEELAQTNAQVQQLQQVLGQYQQHFAQLQQQQNNVQPQAEEIPDPLLDPDGFTSHLQGLVQQQSESVSQAYNEQLRNITLHNSYAHTASQHGEELTKEAMHAADQAGISQVIEASGSRDPIGDVVRWYKNQQTLQTIGGDLTGYLEQREEVIRQNLMKEIEQKKAEAVVDVKVPPSLSNATSAAKAETVIEDDEEFFKQSMS